MCVRRRFCIAISASNLSWPTGVTNSRNVAEAAKVWLLLNLDCKELEKQTWILALSSVIVLWNDDKILKPLIIVLLVMAVDCAVELMKVWSLLLRCDSFVLFFCFLGTSVFILFFQFSWWRHVVRLSFLKQDETCRQQPFHLEHGGPMKAANRSARDRFMCQL